MSTDRFANTVRATTDNNLFDQLTTMTKAYAYDITREDLEKAREENAKLKERVKFLEDLINEYATKILQNLNSK